MNYSYKHKLPAMSGKQHQGLHSFDFGLNKKDEKNGMPQLSFLQFEKPLFAPYVPPLGVLNGTSRNNLSASTPQSDGARIKADLNRAASKTFGESEGESLFDGIDEKSIELNLSLADSVISSNRRRGAYSAADLDNLPNLRGGLAAFYAAAESGDSKAANAAWKLAYTPAKQREERQETKSQTLDFFGEAFGMPETTSIVEQKKLEQKNKTKQLSYSDSLEVAPDADISKNEYFVFGKGNQPSVVSKNYFSKKIDTSPLPDININSLLNLNNLENNKTTVYYGDYWDGVSPKDMTFANQTKEDIVKMPWITQAEFAGNDNYHMLMFKNLASMTSSGKMQQVLDEMIEHFADGTGTPYSNSILTEEVQKHKSTQQYMKDFSKVFCEFIEKHNGDISPSLNSEEFKEALRKEEVFFTKYDYGMEEVLSGLMFAIHGWTESKVDIENFTLADDGTYTGCLKFTFMDNFGLDEDDIKEFGFLPGFRSWYVLQHYDGYEEKYRPFKTVVTIDYPISGKISGSKK